MRALGQAGRRALPDVAVDVGFLEMTDPPAGPVLDELAAAGCRRVVVLPLVLLGAGHAKSDVPAVVLEARQRHPGLHVHFGSPLGITRDLVEVLGAALTRRRRRRPAAARSSPGARPTPTPTATPTR